MNTQNGFVDFTKEMKKDHVILVPDIFPVHMSLLTEVLRMYGYQVEVLHYTGQKVLDEGLRHIHNDMCYPAICSCGQLLYALTSGDYDPHKVALMHFQTGGGCRASNYIKLLKKALVDMGLGYVPVISLSFGGMEKYSGFKITPLLLYKGCISLVYGDMLMQLKNQVRPYEVHHGQTQQLVETWTDRLVSQFKRNRGLTGRSITKNLKAMAADFHAIEKTSKKKIKVGIVGEIYVKYAPFGNNDLEEFLFSQGCEYMVPGVLGFVYYCASGKLIDWQLYGGSRFWKYLGVFMERILNSLQNKLRSVLSAYDEFVTPASFPHVKSLAETVISKGVKMGEGWLLPAEMCELIENGYQNIVCAQPFGCLPNHIVGKGVIRNIKNRYPNANIAPIDYDAGATKVNQENRIKLMLAVARESLLRPFEMEVNLKVS